MQKEIDLLAPEELRQLLSYRSSDKSSVSSLRARSYELLRLNYSTIKPKLKTIVSSRKWVLHFDWASAIILWKFLTIFFPLIIIKKLKIWKLVFELSTRGQFNESFVDRQHTAYDSNTTTKTCGNTPHSTAHRIIFVSIPAIC